VLGIPCLTLRTTTERPVTVSVGTNTVVGSDPVAIQDNVGKILAGRTRSVPFPSSGTGMQVNAPRRS
jgi:UDP-N-acetylglucosamine 2-epimerase (non-hydrolysing)